MKSYSPDEIRNVVVLGHSGSGKTSLLEASLFRADIIKRLGSVNDGNTTSDFDSEEIKRKVSINSTVIPIEWLDTKINFFDTPGYFDFVGEIKSAIKVSDAGLIIVSAKSGLEVGTEKAWEYLEEEGLPKMIFINHMDDEKADFEKTLKELREVFGKAIVPLQIPFFDNGGKTDGLINLIKRDARVKIDGKLSKCDMPENVKGLVEELRAMIVEAAAESDDELLEKYFNNEELTYEEIYRGIKIGVMQKRIAPVICGAAPLGYGVKLMLNSVVKFFPPSSVIRPSVECLDVNKNINITLKNDENEPFSAFVFKTISDNYVGRLNIFRVFSGKIKREQMIYNPEKDTYEKVSHIYTILGKEQKEVDELRAGDIGALSKLANTLTQDSLCSKELPIILPKIKFPKPMLSMAVIPKGKGDEDKISAALARIKEEDNTINIEVNKETKQTLIYGIGE